MGRNITVIALDVKDIRKDWDNWRKNIEEEECYLELLELLPESIEAIADLDLLKLLKTVSIENKWEEPLILKDSGWIVFADGEYGHCSNPIGMCFWGYYLTNTDYNWNQSIEFR